MAKRTKASTFGNEVDLLALRAVARLLRYMFDWEDTPQGHVYWAKVVQNMASLTMLGEKVIDPYKGLLEAERKALMSFLKYQGK